MVAKAKKHVLKTGFTLIEVMVAVAVLSIGLVGGLTAINYNLKNISFTENRIIAGGLAAEGIEFVRNIRDTNWLQGAAWDAGLGIPNIGDIKRIRLFCGGLSFDYLPNLNDNYTGNINTCPGGSPNSCVIYEYKIGSGDPICYSDDFGNSNTVDSITYSRINPRTGLKRIITVERLTSDSIKVNVVLGWNSTGGVLDILTAQETLYNWK